MKTHKNFIAGQWVDACSGETFEDENPADKACVLGRFAASGPEDVDAAVSAAHAASRDWAATPLTDRQAAAEKFVSLLEEHTAEVAEIVTRENGKTIRDSRGEVVSALAEGRYHIEQAPTVLRECDEGGAPGVRASTRYAPLGVVAIISPWNFPVNVMNRKTVPALLAGNTVVFKPASYTPWSGVFMAGLFEQAGVPAGVFNCVTGRGSVVGDALVDDVRVRAVSFTGSTSVGRQIHVRAAKHFTRTQLEMGGKNATIVMADADLDAALDAVITAAFSCAGQWCTSTSRLLLHRPIHDAFLERLRARCEAMVVGDPMSDGTHVGPVAGARQFDGICAAIDRACEDGAELLTGGAAGEALTRQGYYVRPTVLSGVTPDMSVFRDEIFGPVLAVTPFDAASEALVLANDSAYGLSSAIFTTDLDTARQYIDGIDAGMAHVNVHSGFKVPALPFGGWKESGCGLPENSRTGLEFFVDRKAVYVDGL